MTAEVRDRRWVVVSHAYALTVAAAIGYFLMRIPIQVGDAFTALQSLQTSFGALVRDQFFQAGYLRPGLWAEMKLVHDLSGGEYFYWFRTTQVLQVTVLLALFVHVLRPRTPRDAVVVPLAVAVLIGSHTFAWTVREAYPINTFLTILLCCVAAAALSSGPARWWTSPAAVLLFAVSALTVETGLLVWVILATGYLIGWRGVSYSGVVWTTALLAGYFALRFLILANGLPGLSERDSGFGFTRYAPQEIQAMFAANPILFYAYNVLVSLATVLVAEPRNGVFDLTRGIAEGQVDPALVIGFLASTLASAVVFRYVWTRRRSWWSLSFSHEDRLVVVFFVVLLANAAMSFAYTKDVIMSPAGLLYAAAVYVAVRDLVQRPASSTAARLAVAAVVLVLSVTWAIRSVGLHAALDRTAGSVREEWADVEQRLVRMGRASGVSLSPTGLARQLQDDANLRHPSRPQLRDELTTLFEID
jgi:hypothetical protein